MTESGEPAADTAKFHPCQNLPRHFSTSGEYGRSPPTSDAAPFSSIAASTSLKYYPRVVLVETPVFTRLIRELLPDEMYRRLQTHLVINPEAGDVIPHGGGLRKLRWRMEGKGKRGGLRVIYYRIDRGRIYLLYIYRKSDQPDLTSAQLRELRHVIAEDEP